MSQLALRVAATLIVAEGWESRHSLAVTHG